jgi:DNA-binding IclR family transcriptional regulator
VTYRVQSVERGIDILAALSEGPRNLTDIAVLTRLSKGTAFRLLASLSYRNLVVKDPTTTLYTLGPGTLQLLQGVMTGLGAFASVGRPALVHLWERTEETITLHVRLVNERVCIDEIPSPQSLRYTATVGSTAPLYAGSTGKILLAAIDDPIERARFIDSLPITPLTENTILDRAALRKEVDRARRLGWAMSVGERVVGAAAVSVPVSGWGTVASLSVLGPSARLPRKVLMELVPVLRATAKEVEAALSAATSFDDLAKGRHPPASRAS